MADTATAEHYRASYDRGSEDFNAHAAAVEQVIADALGGNTEVVGRATVAAIAADPFPNTGAHPHYARALDDIFDLRRSAAYEARVLEAHFDGMKSFPKTRRVIAEESVARLRSLASGGYHAEAVNVGSALLPDGYHKQSRMKIAYRALGLDDGLTNHGYERERPLLVEPEEVRAERIATALTEEGLSAAAARAAAQRIVALPESKPSPAYSEAVTEVYALRGWFAIEAFVIDEHLAMKSFPKSRRVYAEEQRNRFAALAAGKRVHFGANQHSLDGALRGAGAEPTLSRAEWESHVAEGSWGWMAKD